MGLAGCRAGPEPGSAATDNWPQFRGPAGTGVDTDAPYPLTWDGKTGQGVRWTSAELMPGKASPVVWGRSVFVTGAERDRRLVYCFDAESGKARWTLEVGEAEAGAERDTTVGYAAPGPATDGARVYALFVDGTLVALDMHGREVWSQRLDLTANTYGHASSLVLWRGKVLLQLDQEGEPAPRSALVALDAATGRVAWETRREAGSTWSTPVVIQAAGREEITTCAVPWVVAYAPADGRELWRARCLDGEVVPSATMAGGLVVVANQGAACVAIRPGGSGDVTASRVVWKYDEDLPDVCSPVGVGGRVLLLSSTGNLTCLDAASGRRLWLRRLGEPCSASPVVAGGRVYVLSELGNSFVVDPARGGEVVGRGSLPEQCQATPALAGGRVYVRGAKHLYCLGAK
jgi:outer membrane protein assembly factor BamB